MNLTIALAVATATHFATAGVISALPAVDDAPVFDVDERNTSATLATLATLDLDPSRSKVDFWYDDYASQEDWDKYIHKGGALMFGLAGNDETAGRQMEDPRTPPSARSQFNGDLQTDLQNWYWRNINPSSFSCSLAEHWHFSNALRSLRLDGRPASEGGDNTCYRVEHWDPEKRDEQGNQVAAINQWYNVPGIRRQYHATKAHYEFGINTKGGAIYGLFLESPQAAAKTLWFGSKKGPAKEDLPQLRAFSDVIWGFWNRDNANVRNIRYFFMIGISNDLTNNLIASCLRNAKKQLSEWPGAEFSTATDEGCSLLGSPNGAAVAYFLMQHKAELGQKTITKVTVFRPETDDDNDFVDASLCFHVEDGPQLQSNEAVVSGKADKEGLNVRSTVEGKNKNLIRVHKMCY